MEKVPLLLVRLSAGPLLISQTLLPFRTHTHTHTHTHMNMPSNANLMSQMLRERHEMPQKCHHSTPVTGLIQPLNPPLPCKHIRTYTH